MPLATWATAWVTGASSGIGHELVLQLAASGVRVAATARSADKLTELAAGSGGRILAVPADVTDRAAMVAAAGDIRRALGPLDLVILNAGIWHPMDVLTYNADVAAQSMMVNYIGLANGIEAVLPAMLERKEGHLALVASVAGYRGLPKSSSYAPTKAAVISLAECLHHELYGTGVSVSVINPGFVATPMTRINRFPMPYMISADDAARRMLQGLAKKKFEIAFPWQTVALMEIARRAPNTPFFWFWRTFMTPGNR